MNNMYIKWIVIQLKVCLKRISFWMAIASLVIAGLMISSISDNRSKNVKVLLYRGESLQGADITQRLLRNDIDGFEFEEIEDESEIKTQLIRGYAPCAVVFKDDFGNAFDNNGYNKEIVLYQSSDSYEGYVVKEVLYPIILSMNSDSILENYFDKSGIELSGAQRAQLRSTGEFYREGNILSNYEVEYVNSANNRDEGAGKSYKGIFCLLVLFVIAVTVAQNLFDRNPVYKAIKSKDKWKYVTIELLVLPALITVFSFALMLCAGI